MRRRSSRTSPELGAYEKLAAQVAELEQRIKLLEARVRLVAAREEAWEESHVLGKSRKIQRIKPRPRCPGCLLELPPGRRGDTCVWCGFSFEAVPARP